MKRILVVDDDRDLSDIVKSLLEYAGYEVFVAYAAQEGFVLAKEKMPDLILMDFMLPDMDGADAVHILKSDSAISGIPVIFLTGMVSEDDTQVNETGLNVDDVYYHVVSKPFDNEKLLKEIENILK